MKKLLFSLLGFVCIFALGCSSHTPASLAPAPPAAPAGLTATAGNSQVTLSWISATGATSYNVYYATATGVTVASTTKATGLTATTYSATGLVNGTPYFFIVTAVSGAGESVISSQATATPLPPPPAAPAAITATPGNAQAALSWTASTGATSYNLYYSLSAGVTTATGTKVGNLTGTTYTQTGLTNGSTYFYIVTAVGLGGESLPSVQTSAKPTAPVAAAPGALTASPGNAQASLAWTASSGAVNYNIYYGTSSALSIATGTKVGSLSGPPYTITGLTNGTLYYFLVTAVNTGGESPASVIASATPTNGTTIALAPGTASTATLQATANASLVYTFPATALNANAIATIGPITLAALPAPLVHPTDTFVASFSLSLDPASITAFNAPIGISGSTGSSIPPNTTLNLAILQNNAWVDIATLIVGTTGSLNQNLVSTTLPGLLTPGMFLLYQPTPGSSTTVSNLGIALIGDGGRGMADNSNGLQIVYFYTPNGTLLPSPMVTNLDYPSFTGISAPALSPDGSQGLVVDGYASNHSFSNVQTQTPIALADASDISRGVSIAMLPTGDEAVVSNDDPAQLFLLSGILSGKAVTVATIPIPNNREGLVLSADGKVLLARGPSGLAVFAVAPTTPQPGTNGGTVSHSFTQLTDLTTLGSNTSFQSGRGGMALSPTDSSRAVIVQTINSVSTVMLLTALTSANPVIGTTLTLPAAAYPYCVSVTPDGKLAIVGTQSGLFLYSGVDTGVLSSVGIPYTPSYTLGTASVTLGSVPTLGITLDGKYVLAADSSNAALLVIPFTFNGFAPAPAAVLGNIGIPINNLGDNLFVH